MISQSITSHVTFFLSNPGQRLPLGWSRVPNTWGRLLFFFLSFFFLLFSSRASSVERCGHLVGGARPSCALLIRMLCLLAHIAVHIDGEASASAEVSPRSATLIDKGFFLSLSVSHAPFFCQHLIISKDLQRPPVEILSLGISKQSRLLIASLNAQ